MNNEQLTILYEGYRTNLIIHNYEQASGDNDAVYAEEFRRYLAAGKKLKERIISSLNDLSEEGQEIAWHKDES